MNEFTQILRTIHRPFQQETRNGCQDNVVINGLGSYVKLWLEKARRLPLNLSEEQTVDKLANCFEDYVRLSPTDRLKIIEDATAQIGAIVSEQSVNPPIQNTDHPPTTYTIARAGPKRRAPSNRPVKQRQPVQTIPPILVPNPRHRTLRALHRMKRSQSPTPRLRQMSRHWTF